MNEPSPRRRQVLKGAAAGTAALYLPGLARAAETPIKLGYISPLTGPYALFGETDRYMVEKVRALLKSGIRSGDKTFPVEIIMPSCTSETINPVADQCELNGVPCLSTVQPWQSYFFSRGGKPDKPFEWTYHFFWGLEDIIASYLGMWNSVQTNKKIGFLFERSTDGEAWASKEFGFPPAVTKAGYTFVTPP